MIYPAQTSMIPAQIALVRFLEATGWQSANRNYPYWYLGTTPFRYLTGPILPIYRQQFPPLPRAIFFFQQIPALESPLMTSNVIHM